MDEIETEKKEEQERTTKNKKVFLEELEKSFGIITIACAKAGIGRKTYYRWIDSDEIFKAMCDDVDRHQFDYVHDKFLGLIVKENPGAILFYLKTRNSKYKEKLELSGEVNTRAKFSHYSDEELVEALSKAKEIKEKQDAGNKTTES